MVDSLMNSRVSQLELQRSEEALPYGTESFLSPVEVAERNARRISDYDAQHRSSSRIPFYLIALLLTATAIAKLWMLLTDSFADIRVGLPKEILWISVAFELWLAFENFRVRDHRVLALINTIVFASFGVFATIRLMLGYGSCGCSGSLELPAWIFILIDVAIVGWFTISGSQRSRVGAGFGQLVQENWSAWSPEKRGRWAGIGLFASLIFVLQLPVTGPLRAMVLGEPPLIATVKVSGDLILNQETTGSVEIWNRSSQPAKIIGISRSCRCFDLVGDPISKIIPANERLSLPLVIKPNKLVLLRQRVELFLDHPDQFRVNVDVFGSVKGVR
jgi:hypothetical protein